MFLYASAQTRKVTARDFDNFPDTALVFLAALWCSPCVEKQNYFEQAFQKHPELPYIAIYDTRYYNDKRKAALKYTPEGELLFWADHYYTPVRVRKIIEQTNPLIYLVPELESMGYKIVNKHKIWYGQGLIKRGRTIYIDYKVEKDKRIYVKRILKEFGIEIEFEKLSKKSKG
jgi:hypothetical protein